MAHHAPALSCRSCVPALRARFVAPAALRVERNENQKNENRKNQNQNNQKQEIRAD
jgi:hypothetical protein